ncbi:MAG: protein ImuA [Paracoccaceae bacterium]|jgi:protein ImuA
MSTHLLRRAPERPKPALTLHRDIALTLGRVHEICGPARRTLAMWLAGQTRGPVLWISPAWEAAQLNPDGMLGFADPARFLFVTPRRAEDLLWACEEALRAGAVSLVIADLPGPPALTPVRRMHLAAETGATMGPAPLGLLLTPGDGGAQGVETRWHMTPTHESTHEITPEITPEITVRRWRLERRRARTLPPQAWTATQTCARSQPDLVSEPVGARV